MVSGSCAQLQWLPFFANIIVIIINFLLALFIAMNYNKYNPRLSRIPDSTPWIPDSRYWIPDSLSVVRGFRIQILSGIPHSLSCFPESRSQYSGFHEQKFPESWNPDSLIWGEIWNTGTTEHSLTLQRTETA